MARDETETAPADAAAEAFIARWKASGGSERSNYQSFLIEPCDLLKVPHPEPASAVPGNLRMGATWQREQSRRITSDCSGGAHGLNWKPGSRVVEHMLATKLVAGAEWRTEAIEVRARKTREAYAGTSSSPPVQLTEERLVAVWLQLQLAELIVNVDDAAVTSTKSVAVLDRHDRRLSRASKNLNATHSSAGTDVDAEALMDVEEEGTLTESSESEEGRAEEGDRAA